jgi:hypothetical protein
MLVSTGPIYFPSLFWSTQNSSFGTFVLDAANEKAGMIFTVPKAGTISKVGFTTRTVTTGATVDVRIETVGGDGFPTGTLWATNTNGAQVIADANDNTWFLKSLTAGAVVAEGDIIAVVVVTPSGGNMEIGRARFDEYMFPYTAHFTSSWAKATNTGTPLVALEYNDGSYGVADGVYPITSITAVSYNSGSTPDEKGLILSLPFKCRAIGAWAKCSPTAGGTMRYKLYDSDGSTVLAQTPSLDQDIILSTDGNNYHCRFTSAVTLQKDAAYRLTILPETATDVQPMGFGVNAAAIMDSFCGGQNIHLTTRTDGGSWSQTATERLAMGLLIDQFDDGRNTIIRRSRRVA